MSDRLIEDIISAIKENPQIESEDEETSNAKLIEKILEKVEKRWTPTKYGFEGDFDLVKIQKKLEILKELMESEETKRNIDKDIKFYANIINAIFREYDIENAKELCKVLSTFFRSESGKQLKNSMQRIDGLLKEADFNPTPDMKVNPDLFTTQAEHDLYNSIIKLENYQTKLTKDRVSKDSMLIDYIIQLLSNHM